MTDELLLLFEKCHPAKDNGQSRYYYYQTRPIHDVVLQYQCETFYGELKNECINISLWFTCVQHPGCAKKKKKKKKEKEKKRKKKKKNGMKNS